jgi:ABC-type transport system substrate-binding protein
MRVYDFKSPHTFNATSASNVVRQTNGFLTITGADNVTRPALVEQWNASPDLRTWTLYLRQGAKWRKGGDVEQRLAGGSHLIVCHIPVRELAKSGGLFEPMPS